MGDATKCGWSRVTCVVALAAAILGPGADACRAALIISTTPLPGGRVLPLPDVATTRELSVIDPDTGVAITMNGQGNLFGAQSATDRLIRVPGSADLEAFFFTFSAPDVYTGVTVRDVALTSTGGGTNNVLVLATDQFGGSSMLLSLSGTVTISILATGGSTLRSFAIITPEIGSGIGPIELQAVPEPSTLVMAGSGVIALVGYAWRRRRGAVVA
jgi:hypothetical protein